MNANMNDEEIMIQSLKVNKPTPLISVDVPKPVKRGRGRPKQSLDKVKRKGLDSVKEDIKQEFKKELDEVKLLLKDYLATPASEMIILDSKDSVRDAPIPSNRQLENSRSESEHFRNLAQDARKISYTIGTTNLKSGGLIFK